MSERISLADLGVDDDPGSSWHPRPDKTDVRDEEGNLRDLTDDDLAEHLAKPEAVTHESPGEPLAAEDSTDTPEGQV